MEIRFQAITVRTIRIHVDVYMLLDFRQHAAHDITAGQFLGGFPASVQILVVSPIQIPYTADDEDIVCVSIEHHLVRTRFDPPEHFPDTRFFLDDFRLRWEKDIIEDGAIDWGKDYVTNMEAAIAKNKEFVESILALNAANAKVRGAGSQKELQEATKKANDEGERALKVWKEQDQLEVALISTKRKNLLATESTNKALIKERTLLNETNKEIRAQVREQLGLVSAYDKLNAKRTVAKKTLQDLIATEGASIASIKKAQIEFDRLDAKVKKADDAVRDFTKNVGNYPQIQNLTNGLKNLVQAFGVVTGIGLFVQVTKAAFQIVVDFEAEIVNLAAVAGKSRDEIKPLEDTIRQVAAESVNGATDVAKLATELIKLGSSPEEAAKLLKPVNDSLDFDLRPGWFKNHTVILEFVIIRISQSYRSVSRLIRHGIHTFTDFDSYQLTFYLSPIRRDTQKFLCIGELIDTHFFTVVRLQSVV